MRIKTTITFLFVFFNCYLFLNGQVLLTRNYTTENGLVSNNINSICQDSSGFIWFATGEGLSRFDSKDFTNYTIEDGLPTNNILCAAVDKKDGQTVWLGTVGKGVVKYKNGKFISIPDSRHAVNPNIDCLYMDKEDTLWCGTDSSVFLIRNDKIITLKNNAGIKAVNSICAGSSGNIFIAANNGFFTFIRSENTFVKMPLGKFDNSNFTSVIPLPDNSVLLLTYQGNLIKFSENTFKYYSLNHIGEFSNIYKSFNPGLYWITSDHGLYKVNVKSMKSIIRYTKSNGLPNDNVSCMLTDREGILWLGTNNNGASKIVRTNLIKIDLKESVKNVYNVSTVTDKNNHVWVTTSDRLVELWDTDHYVWHKKTHLKLDSRAKSSLSKLFIVDDSELIVTYTSGMIKKFKIINNYPHKYGDSKLIRLSSVDLSKKYKFYSLFVSMQDRDGYLWTSALDLGVIVLNNSKEKDVLKIYTMKDRLPDNSIRCIFQDKNGNYWFGGYQGGLTFFSKDKVMKDLGLNYDPSKVKVIKYTTQNGLPNNAVRSVAEDDSGTIYIGTRYGGLAILQNGKFKVISRSKGLLSNGVWKVSCTGYFGTWLATQAGVQKLNAGGTLDNKLSEYIPKIPFYSISYCRNKIIFANPTEIYIYEPDRGHLIIRQPTIFINKILVNGQKYKIKKKIELANFQNNISFEFTGIINREEHRIYEYRLLNKEETWNKIRNKNSVTYSYLNPGKYTFQVTALLPDGSRSNKPAEITFMIDSPFYRQWWFDFIILAIIVSVIVLFLRYRVKRILAIERVRSKIAAELHDEIGAGLTKIAILSEHALLKNNPAGTPGSLKNNTRQQNTSIERVGTIARGLVDQMVDVIWSIDPKYDKLEDFIIHFKNYAYEVCEAKNISLEFNTGNIRDIKLDSNVKRKLQLISTEALTNAVKHSGCARINYSLIVKDKAINVEVKDNGTGIDPDKKRTGNGLMNMKKHTEELNGAFAIETGNGSGTIVKIWLPLKSKLFK